MLRRIFAAVLAGLMLMGCALAQDCFTIDIDTLDLNSLNSDDYVERKLSASTQGVRVVKYLSDSSELAAAVRLTLTQMDSRTIVYDRDYGYQSGTFDSGVIYLPYAGDRTAPYLITLYVGDYVYALPFMQLQPRLQGNSACTAGLRLTDVGVSLGGDWQMGTMVDLSSSTTLSVDIVASNHYLVGQATITTRGASLKVDLSFYDSANVSLERSPLYLITDCQAFQSGSTGPAYSVGEWIDLGSASTAMIYLPLRLSYDPSGLPAFAYGHGVDAQRRLWQQNIGPSAAPDPYVPSAPASSWDDGWSSGWSEGSGWDDGWSGSGDGWQ
ncbi:MAG: hypothetical protein IJ354_05580 [Clostridia bacterium]|nr:hypothetical protein [Clostridia bacterium]